MSEPRRRLQVAPRVRSGGAHRAAPLPAPSFLIERKPAARREVRRPLKVSTPVEELTDPRFEAGNCAESLRARPRIHPGPVEFHHARAARRRARRDAHRTWTSQRTV